MLCASRTVFSWNMFEAGTQVCVAAGTDSNDQFVYLLYV